MGFKKFSERQGSPTEVPLGCAMPCNRDAKPVGALIGRNCTYKLAGDNDNINENKNENAAVNENEDEIETENKTENEHLLLNTLFHIFNSLSVELTQIR